MIEKDFCKSGGTTMLNLRHLQYLNAVYQYKNFTQAGDSLFVSQPTISAAINTLESDLGVKLIE